MTGSSVETPEEQDQPASNRVIDPHPIPQLKHFSLNNLLWARLGAQQPGKMEWSLFFLVEKIGNKKKVRALTLVLC